MLALWACVASAQPNEGRIADSETFSPHAVVAGKSISKSECSALQYAVWVEHQHGAECLRYYSSPGIDGVAPTQ